MNPRTAASNAAAALAAAPLIAAKVHASRHRIALDASTRCACFFCFRSFPRTEIKAWIDAETTALCPRCGLDAVLGDASLASISDGFLRRMHEYHFSSARVRPAKPR
jgi:hypothetical protein